MRVKAQQREDAVPEKEPCLGDADGIDLHHAFALPFNDAMNTALHRQWLMELTSLPTAAGREDQVIHWIERWAKARKDCKLSRDRHGNLVIQSATAKSAAKRPPIYFTAHLDHPAFVVKEIVNDRELIADFRGGVEASYFKDATVMLARTVGGAHPARGRITSLTLPIPGKTLDKSVLVRFAKAHHASPGDVLTWHLKPTSIRGDRVKAPACDDLAGVAAALAAFDRIHSKPRRSRHASPPAPDVRLLLTRCEEVGFIGAIGACKAKTMERHALVIALENSKSFAESPIGGGPIVRVGDRTSTFDPDLTYRIGMVAQALAQEDKSFQWQRKLMTGGTCEASAYQSFGHIATCLCLPLGNYHNMNEKTQKIDHEIISLSDYDNLIKLLAAIGQRLHDPTLAPPLKPRLEKLFASRKSLL